MFNISDSLISAPGRDIILIPGDGMVEATFSHSIPGRKNLARYTIRYKVSAPRFSQFVSLISDPYTYPTTEWYEYLDRAKKQEAEEKKRDPNFNGNVLQLDKTDFDKQIQSATVEKSYKYPKLYPGFKVVDNVYLRNSYISGVVHPDIYMPATELGQIFNRHIVSHIRNIQSCDVIYRKTVVRIFNGIKWITQGNTDNKFVALSGPTDEPTRVFTTQNMGYKFKAGSNVTGKVLDSNFTNPLPLAIAIYPTRAINENIIDRPSRLIINGTRFRNSSEAMGCPHVIDVQQALHSTYSIPLSMSNPSYGQITFTPIFEIQSAFRTAETVQLEGISRRAASYLRRDVVLNQKQDLIQDV